MKYSAFDIAINGQKVMEKVAPPIMPMVMENFFEKFGDDGLAITVTRFIYDDGQPDPNENKDGIEKVEGEAVAPENVVPMQQPNN